MPDEFARPLMRGIAPTTMVCLLRLFPGFVLCSAYFRMALASLLLRLRALQQFCKSSNMWKPCSAHILNVVIMKIGRHTAYHHTPGSSSMYFAGGGGDGLSRYGKRCQPLPRARGKHLLHPLGQFDEQEPGSTLQVWALG